MILTEGEIYKRTDIHDYFGGQRQGGISTPKEHDVIFIFSGDSGESYGYQDGWVDNQFFYTGEGQKGDMAFIKGNKAIRDHSLNGKKIVLFTVTSPKTYVRHEGEFQCIDYDIFRTQDIENQPRNAIRFILEKFSTAGFQSSSTKNSKLYTKPNTTERKGLITSRVGQGYYRQQLIEKFEGKCAVTGCPLQEILIASHILPWRLCNDEQRLDIENGILLSPLYDALFDKHLISFNSDGNLIISSLLTVDDIANLGINIKTKIFVSEGMQPYLEEHIKQLQ